MKDAVRGNQGQVGSSTGALDTTPSSPTQQSRGRASARTAHDDSGYMGIARAAIDHGEHYLHAVANLAGRKSVAAAEDIVASNGTKLIAKGAAIDRGLRQRLLWHTLKKPLQNSLAAEQNVDGKTLAHDAGKLIQETPYLQRLAKRSGDLLAIQHGPAHIQLPAAMAFNLTLAREQHPRLYQHLLHVSVVAHYLALRLELSHRDSEQVLAAALFHDLGELHTDPAVLDPTHRITAEERRFIHVHPITGYLIACDAEDVPAAVSQAILQHQERLDGSGYPFGLRGSDIGQFARVVAVADVCASVMARYGKGERLVTLMRLNRQKYDAKLLGLLQEGLERNDVEASYVSTEDSPRLQQLAQLLHGWAALHKTLPDMADPAAPAHFLWERMGSLRSMLVQFGFDSDSPDLLIDLARDDPQIAAELTAVLDEMHWQFSDLNHEIGRRRPALLESLSESARDTMDIWTTALEDYLRSYFATGTP